MFHESNCLAENLSKAGAKISSFFAVGALAEKKSRILVASQIQEGASIGEVTLSCHSVEKGAAEFHDDVRFR